MGREDAQIEIPDARLRHHFSGCGVSPGRVAQRRCVLANLRETSGNSRMDRKPVELTSERRWKGRRREKRKEGRGRLYGDGLQCGLGALGDEAVLAQHVVAQENGWLRGVAVVGAELKPTEEGEVHLGRDLLAGAGPEDLT